MGIWLRDYRAATHRRQYRPFGRSTWWRCGEWSASRNPGKGKEMSEMEIGNDSKSLSLYHQLRDSIIYIYRSNNTRWIWGGHSDESSKVYSKSFYVYVRNAMKGNGTWIDCLSVTRMHFTPSTCVFLSLNDRSISWSGKWVESMASKGITGSLQCRLQTICMSKCGFVFACLSVCLCGGFAEKMGDQLMELLPQSTRDLLISTFKQYSHCAAVVRR